MPAPNNTRKKRVIAIQPKIRSGVCKECGETWTSDSVVKELCGKHECEKSHDRKMYAARVEKKKLAKERAAMKAEAVANASA